MNGTLSLRRRLLVGILVPVVLLIALNGASLYTGALAAANTAYDRTLLASAKTIGDQLDVQGYDDNAVLRATVPYAALEAFEADNRSRMVYRVSNLRGSLISGYGDLAFWRGTLPQRPPYAALVDYYDDTYEGRDVRVAVLLQPVASSTGRAMAVVQVAETLELRETLARRILVDTMVRQAVLVAVIALVVVLVVQLATRPVRRLSQELRARPEGDLTPIAPGEAPREVLPLIDATNSVMSRLQHLLDDQKRFVRDTAHQLRTPLAVLKAQVQSAQRGDVGPQQALAEIGLTVDRATALANQMLSLAKVEQLRQEAGSDVADLAAVARKVALELAPLIADREIEFDIATVPAPVAAHEWMLGELARNLIHNAIKHIPHGGSLSVRVLADARTAALTVSDNGPGLPPEVQARLFQPFAGGNLRSGSGLGLAICHEIVRALGGTIGLDTRTEHGRVTGLDATVRLPLAQNPA
jgi:two-component system sensor histidine kinase TctE